MVQYLTTGFSRNDIIQAVQIQLAEIGQGFLSSLGAKFVELLFEHVVSSKWGVVVLAIDEANKGVVGYVLGTIETRKLYWDFALRKLPKALFFFIPKMFSFKRIIRAFETISYPHKNKDQTPHLPSAELLDLAVEAPYHGKGIAQGLFKAFLTEFQKRGVKHFRIPTGRTLKRAHRFYEKMGATKACEFELHRGEVTVVYVCHVK